jgi:signal transduction histidine kinase/ligand-binding sensor domain-containing protein
MAHGPKGQIWMTGPSGLSKFDGYSVHNFIHDPADEYSVPEGLIMEILTDSNGKIWLTGSSGVSYLDPWTERFHQISIPDSIPPVSISSPSSLLETSDHFIWMFGNANGGLYRYSLPTKSQPDPTVRFYPHDFIEDEEITVFYLAEVSDEFIWLTSNQGLIQFDRTTEAYTKIDPLSGLNTDLEITQSTEILRDTKGDIWLGVDGGLIVFREGKNSPDIKNSLGKDNFDLSNTRISALHPAADGDIFIGISGQGLLHYDPSSDDVVQYSRQENSQGGLSENNVWDILEDRNGNVWMGHSSSGMSMMYEKNWSYSYHQFMERTGTNNRSNVVRDIAEDQDFNLWIATPYGIAFVPADGGAMRLYLPDPEVPSSDFNENNITNIQLHGDIIFVVEYNGDNQTSTFYTFDIQQEQFNAINIPDSLTAVRLNDVVATESVIYWTAMGISKLVALNKDDLSIEAFDLPLDYPMWERTAQRVEAQPIITHSGDLYILYKYAPPNIYTTSDWGYFKFDAAQGVFTRVPMSVNRDLRKYAAAQTQFPSVVEDGVIWSMAENGILKENLNDGTFEYFPLDLNLNELTFSSGLQASDGSIWFTGVTGAIRKFDPQSKKVNTYTPELSRKPTFIFSSFELSNGSLFFGGNGGYIQFDPDDIREEVDIQHLHITEFRTGTENIPTIDPDEKYEVDYENNNISFSYLAINYRSPDNQYRYRLLGYSDDWVNMGTQRSIFLANLPFGDYSFQVQASTPGSSFSDESILSEVTFAILPPWWRTIPAYLSYLLLSVGFVVGVDRVQRRRLIQKERERAREKELEQAKEIEKAYQNLEIAHKDLEQAHSNLKSAQNQLVQQEKLASLGQLTAGIAHEIKNPLNFVNNFSEVSLELIEEALEELKNYPSESEEVDDILADIATNLRKIHEHGTRADSIVKSMLEHSRGGSGKMEPTDLNALVKEFVNLTFHGMRASKNPINVEMVFDLDESIGEVPLITEDFSRVIVNLCNNSFDAMREKIIQHSTFNIQKYSPKLTVHTKADKGNVAIKIEDNGPGIPEEIKDKILQPFFTTKKGTAGTGLGLSITNDIIKAHGGTLSIESKSGEGSSFIITLSS